MFLLFLGHCCCCYPLIRKINTKKVKRKLAKVVYVPLNSEANGTSGQVTRFSKSGFFSELSFWWLNPLMKRGREKTLEEEDIPSLHEADRAESCYLQFLDQLNKQKQIEPSSQPSILRTIIICHRREIFISGFFALLKILTFSAGPLLLNAFILVAEGKTAFQYEGYVLAMTLFISKGLESLSLRQWYFRSRVIGLKVRSLLTAAIYKKQLRLSNAARLKHSGGEIMNYVTVDAYGIGEFPFWFHQTWTTSLRLCIAIVILFRAVGLTTFVALVVIILTVLCGTPLAKLQHKFQSKLMVAQDERLKATTEALVNMKVLKLYAWETHFKNFIENLRPIRNIPDVIGAVIQAKVSFTRIVKFLEAPELQSANVRQKSNLGNIQVYGKIAYVSQTAWIQTGSIRENILFGSSMDTYRYHETLERCSLVKDLELLPYGDQTEIGEGGINLSGGQKQRIQLARALYQDADIYLLDDPFSAMDAHTATSLFNEYVMGALSRKAVFLVTHQVDFLPAFDSVLLMSDGEILKTATYHQLLSSSKEFQDLVNAYKETAGSERLAEVTSQNPGAPAKEIKRGYVDKQSEASKSDQLIKKEEREIGDTGMRSSQSLFSPLLDSLFRAPMSFYDSTPLGRVLSLVSFDLSIVDLDILFSLILSVAATINAYSNLGVLVVVTWQVLFVSIPVIFMAIRLQRYYFYTAKELMRINGTAKSLVANHLAESIAGATIIRAFQEEERFFAKNLDIIDTNAIF
ncbi:hypothetical protein Patl1_20292 [Pistacia atlantica]|uniref:Uncharacterized protein n=1 Tax=Pistacia atlantica TaxID=434234 RepID=A0ACC1BKJ1_9ROSI|nr:hypothetical protein Patl1_20292 [Pistacia atlantica]